MRLRSLLQIVLPIALWIGGGGSNGFAALTTNHAQTSPAHSDPTLRTRHISRSYVAVFETALEVARTLPRWKIVGHDKASGWIQVERRTRVFKFVDDIRIQITEEEEEGTVALDIASQSRVGSGDFGQNARNIREFLAALDR